MGGAGLSLAGSLLPRELVSHWWSCSSTKARTAARTSSPSSYIRAHQPWTLSVQRSAQHTYGTGAREMGRRGREVARERFGRARFEDAWSELLDGSLASARSES